MKKTLLENMKPDKISFNNISVKNQQIKTNKIVKNNIEFLNDKRYISDINENIPHTLYIECYMSKIVTIQMLNILMI